MEDLKTLDLDALKLRAFDIQEQIDTVHLELQKQIQLLNVDMAAVKEEIDLRLNPVTPTPPAAV